MKKTLIATIALAAIAASPAFAASKYSRVRHLSDDVRAQGGYSYLQNDWVIANNKIIGRDPDINVRLQMLRDASQSDY
ncbi:MAG TPA: hypothetical protein VET48_09930 [Steroidobacteraceae bacterium]|nr:hypothetical protein [Steroidobacteraceae bacterium]